MSGCLPNRRDMPPRNGAPYLSILSTPTTETDPFRVPPLCLSTVTSSSIFFVFFACELWNTSYSIYWYVIFADAPPSNAQHSMFVVGPPPFVVSVSLSSLDTGSWLESGSKWSFTCI